MQLMEYLNDFLGLDAKLEECHATDDLPLFLTGGREFKILRLGEQKLLIVESGRRRFSSEELIRDYARLSEETGLHTVFVFTELSTYQRKTLIRNHVPFILPGAYLYIPFLMISFNEEPCMNPVNATRHLSPMEQMIWLYMLYHNEPQQQIQIAETLHVPQTYVSRSAKRLESLGLIRKFSMGRKGFLDLNRSEGDRAQLLDKTWDMMGTPVSQIVTVTTDRPTMNELVIAGETALSNRTMLGLPYKESYAASRSWIKGHRDAFTYFRDDDEIAPQESIILESWRYDPKPLAHAYGDDSMADPISVGLSIRDVSDERVEQAVEHLIKNLTDEWAEK